MISVIVPVYNVEKFLPRCIESILAQTHRDIEVLLIDDGSPDSSGEICDRYAASDSRVRVFHIPNGGVASARNLGIDNARGEYLAFVDSDDWIEPDMYEIMLRELIAADADVCGAGWFHEYAHQTTQKIPQRRIWEGEDTARAFFLEELNYFCWNKLFRRRVFEELRFPDGRVAEDVLAICYAVVDAGRAVTVDIPLYHYRIVSNGITRQFKMKRLSDYWAAMFERYEKLKDVEPMKSDPVMADLLIRGCARAISRMWRWAYPNKDRGEYRALMGEMSDFSRHEIRKAGMKGWPATLKFPVILSRSGGTFSLWLGYSLNQIYRKIHPTDTQDS